MHTAINRLVIVLAFATVLAATTAAPLLAGYEEPPIRVGLAVGIASTIIKSDGAMELRQSKERLLLATTEPAASITFKIDGGEIISSTGHKASGFLVFSKGGNLEFDGRKYRGSFQVVVDGDGLTVVNSLPIEDYLRGVVPSEISPAWETEAIKAQAVAARTYALNRMADNYDRAYDVVASTSDQLYRGMMCEDQRTDAAISATHGITMTYDGAPIIAYYSASAAGCTAGSDEAFGRDIPYLRPVISLDADAYNWSLRVTYSELTGALASLGLNIGKPKDIVIDEYAPSGYVKSVKIDGSNGSAVVLARDLRKALGYGKFKSTCFAIGDNGAFPPISVVSDPAGDGDITQLSARILTQADNNEIMATSSDGPETTDISQSIVISASGRSHLGEGCYMLGWNSEVAQSIDFSDSESAGEFTPVNIGDGITFIGRGFGHGAGMSQHGALNYAKAGWDYERILKHYYYGIELTKSYD